MSSRNEASKDETRELESTDDETPVIPIQPNSEVRLLSRIFGVHQASAASMPGTSGGAHGAAAPAAPAPRRTPRQERDRLFWTLLGNSSRTSSNRCRSSSARAPRPASFADLLEPERRRARAAALLSRYASPAAYKPSTSFTSLDSSLRNMLRKRPLQTRGEASSSGNGASSSSGRHMIVVRARGERAGCGQRGGSGERAGCGERGQRGADAPDGGRAAHEGDGRARNAATAALDHIAEQPSTTATTALALEEEILALEPPAPAPRPDGDGEETEPANVLAEPNQQARGTKRKRDREVTGDTHESVSTLNQSILRLLECPVCMEWMEPPIAQCRRGHLVCGTCRKRLETCPVCRTAFSSVRNRAMEDVASILRYPCRHGCGRSVRAARRQRHEASCAARRHACPLPACRAAPPMPRSKLAQHCQTKHPESFRTGTTHRVSLGVGSEQHVQWVVSALGALFHVCVDVDARIWGILAHATHLGPVDQAPRYTYEVTVLGRHNGRRLSYRRATQNDLENVVLNTSRRDCFHLSFDQAYNYLRYKNEQAETDKTLDLTITLAEAETEEDVVADSG